MIPVEQDPSETCFCREYPIMICGVILDTANCMSIITFDINQLVKLGIKVSGKNASIEKCHEFRGFMLFQPLAQQYIP